MMPAPSRPVRVISVRLGATVAVGASPASKIGSPVGHKLSSKVFARQAVPISSPVLRKLHVCLGIVVPVSSTRKIGERVGAIVNEKSCVITVPAVSANSRDPVTVDSGV